MSAGWRRFSGWPAWALAWLVVAAIAWVRTRDIWIGPDGRDWAVTESMVYWGSWLLWPALAQLGFAFARHTRERRRGRALLAAFGLVLCVTFAWGRWVEANRLVVRQTALPLGCGVRIALISDLHVGLFGGTERLAEVVRTIDGLGVDAVLVAGDWTYQSQRDLRAAFAPLAALKTPAYGVLGNHDDGFSGTPAITQPLREALGSLGVRLIEGERVDLGRCELVGLGDYLAGSAARDLARLLPQQVAYAAPRPRVVLTHEPETLRLLPPGWARAALFGHTHGGQINIPYLTRPWLEHALPGGLVGGLYRWPGFSAFITTGIGTDHLPVRLGVPPSIDVLTL